MIVRPARLEDVPTIVKLWREMWEVHFAVDPRYEPTPFCENIMTGWVEKCLASEGARVWVAEEGEIIGYVNGMILENPPVVPWTQFGYVSELAVDGRFRRRGVGAALVTAIHEWFRSVKIPYVEVNVSVRNALSRSFWRKVGYGEFLERLRMDL